MPHNDTATTPARSSAGEQQQDEPRFSGRLPYYRRYTSDYLGSAMRHGMTPEQRGVWSDVEAWVHQERSIPDDRDALLGLLALRDPDVFDRVWPAITKYLVPHPDLTGQLTRPGALQQRAEYAAYLHKQRSNGRRGGRPRKNPRLSHRVSGGEAYPSPLLLPSPEPSSPPSPDSLRAPADPHNNEKKEKEGSCSDASLRVGMRREVAVCPCGFRGRGFWITDAGANVALEACPKCHRGEYGLDRVRRVSRRQPQRETAAPAAAEAAKTEIALATVRFRAERRARGSSAAAARANSFRERPF